jgi:hypothetical protein
MVKTALRGEPILAYQESSTEALIRLVPPSIIPFVLLYMIKVLPISILSSSSFVFLYLWGNSSFYSFGTSLKKIQRLVTLLVVSNCMVLALPKAKITEDVRIEPFYRQHMFSAVYHTFRDSLTTQ